MKLARKPNSDITADVKHDCSALVELTQQIRKEFSESETVDVGKISAILEAFKCNTEECLSTVQFDTHQYSRHLLSTSSKFSLILISWNPGQKTPIHTHGKQEERLCWMKVLQGKLKLSKFDECCTLKESVDISEGDKVVPCNNANLGLHILENTTDSQVISIHLYSPPYIECCFTNEKKEQSAIPAKYCLLDNSPLHKKFLQRVAIMKEVNNPLFTNLYELVQLLDNHLASKPINIDTTAVMLEAVRLNKKEYSQYATFQDKKYTRNLVAYSAHYTLLMLCWDKGQESPIHDHAGSSCFMKMLQGELQEVRYDATNPNKLEVKQITDMPTNSVKYIDDTQGVHLVRNPSKDEVAISLHIYVPPYASCNCFDLKTGEVKEVSMACVNSTGKEVIERNFREEKAYSISELITELSQVFKSDIPETLKITQALNSVKLDSKEWDEIVHFSTNRYVRILVASDAKFSLVLNCWNKNQFTPVHDHGGLDRCSWLKVISGSLKHVQFTKEGEELCEAKSIDLTADSVPFYMDGGTPLHKTGNSSEESTAISLHLYSPPYIDCCFEERGSKGTIPAVYCAKSSVPKDVLLSRPIFSNFAHLTDVLRKIFSDKTWKNINCKISHIATILQNFKFNYSEIERYSQFNNEHYYRCLIARNSDFEIYLTSWLPCQASEIHNHDNSTAWIKVLYGCLEETKYSKSLDAVSTNCLSTKSVNCSKAGEFHRIQNLNKGKTVSLHIYSPPYSNSTCIKSATKIVPANCVFCSS